MPSFPFLQLLWKFSDLRDEAARGVALLPQINAALAEPLVYKKLELFAPIANEVCLILASGIKDLDPNLSFGAADDSEGDVEEELKAVYAAMGLDFNRFKEFVVNATKLAKEVFEEVKPYLPFILLFLDEKK
jgi:hypothetical protein